VERNSLAVLNGIAVRILGAEYRGDLLGSALCPFSESGIFSVFQSPHSILAADNQF
jgi:hypothetical protein